MPDNPDRRDDGTAQPAPPVTSLGEWNVGRTDNGTAEIRFELKDNAEAREWLIWLMDQGGWGNVE